ncbi:protein AF-10 isoform X7 [Ostrinia furnacalis]|uniref:protein AF-10 isoform X7 n=1 Tax=Ostrinia furnacalis TaxID=93504 RepID=UPI00103D95D4|nr:protein AF-10 isoform X7 [Ostrinia furnacalis]XP_028160588.1 protein AF-10 isoform X7 [Ostrinia furnacalis]
MKEMVGGCCVCSDERGWPDNPLVYCDGNGCTVAVHQACYGIVTVPTGPWFCRKCECPDIKGKVKCELCPSKSGALKRTDTGGWAHVVCALYIPEVRFGNVTSMEPIVLRLIPPERYNKTCYICHDQGKTHRSTAGACMQCNKSGCKQQFHVTCAQSLGLLCEEAGNYLDNVKYCGYCQHHYSKLKKGGNVKTIPPYKPVSHDSQSSDSSGEKEDDASSVPGGSGTPTQATKSKGPGRKSSAAAGKSNPSTTKTATVTSQSLGGKQHSDKKKPSPSRRGSSAGDGGSSSKASTPAPSPQHPPPEPQPSTSKAGGSTPGPKATPPPASPSAAKVAEPVGVINTAPPASSIPLPTTPATSVTQTITTSVVHSIPTSKPPSSYQESVITNTDAIDTKQTKKRKAISAANTPAATPVDYTSTAPQVVPNEVNPPPSVWEGPHPGNNEIQHDPMDKIIKKAKTDGSEAVTMPAHFSSLSPAPPPPPPPPAHSPASNPSPRHLPSPMPGPSGMNTASTIRSPQPPPQAGKERNVQGHRSLLVSVPLPSTSHGLNLSTHAQVPSLQTRVSAASDLSRLSPHIFHQPQKLAAMEPSMSSHIPHNVPGRSAWGGLNVAYEMQQDPNKPGVSGVPGTSKDINLAGIPMPPAAIRTKKRAAMAASVVNMATAPPPPTPMRSVTETVTSQSLANVRRAPQPTPPPLYQETIRDSPPVSPSSERPLRQKLDANRLGVNCTAPHMLGNELNPESGAAARLQEQLTAELAAHAAGGAGPDSLVPPPLINKAAASGGQGRGTSSAQSLDQLLERQWEQGSQFLMEQAQHFDIASLLSCLHQLRTENVRLEEHVGNLLQRRDHLLAVNARLAIPLSTGQYVDGVQMHTAYNASGVPVSGPPGPDPPRLQRDNSQVRAPSASVRAPETITSERPHQLMMREVQQKPS